MPEKTRSPSLFARIANFFDQFSSSNEEFSLPSPTNFIKVVFLSFAVTLGLGTLLLFLFGGKLTARLNQETLDQSSSSLRQAVSKGNSNSKVLASAVSFEDMSFNVYIGSLFKKDVVLEKGISIGEDASVAGTIYGNLTGNVVGNLKGNVTGDLVGNVSGGKITPQGFTQGSVVFTGSGGTLTQDNSNLYWNDTDNKLGIATNSPNEPLDVRGRIYLGDTSAPSTTTNRLYAVSGDLYWNASKINASTSYTNYWNKVSGNLISVTGGDTLSATSSASTVATFTATGSNNALRAGGSTSYLTVDSSGNLVTAGSVHIGGALYDSGDGVGTSGQVLSSTVTGVDWVDLPAGATNYWQLTSGSLASYNETFALNIGSTSSESAYFHAPGSNNDNAWFNLGTGSLGIGTTSPTQPLHVAGNMRLEGALYDSDNSVGTPGYLLSTTGTGVEWIDSSSVGPASLWQETLGSLSPANITDALNIGALATSSAYFHVAGTNNQNAWFNLGTGKLGIGTTAPSVALDVIGAIAASTYFSGGSSANTTNIQATGSVGGDGGNGSIYFRDVSGAALGRIDTKTVTQTVDINSDGALTVNADTTINSVATTGTAGAAPASGQKVVNVNSTTGFSTGDVALVIQMKGGPGAGYYDKSVIMSVGANTITLGNNLTNSYSNTTAGRCNSSDANCYQVVKIPRYTSVTVNVGYTLTAPAWDPTTGTGGILWLETDGGIDVKETAVVNMEGKGYTGGTAGTAGTGGSDSGGDGSTGGAGGSGEGLSYGGGGSAAGNGGKGGGTSNNSAGGGAGGTGGGGGGAGGVVSGGTAGSAGISGAGGNGAGATSEGGYGGTGGAGAGGSAGSQASSATITSRIVMGSGGGAGAGGAGGGGFYHVTKRHVGADGGLGGAGGAGGGIIVFSTTSTITNSGTVKASGSAGSGGSDGNDALSNAGGGAAGAGGGGGSGGAIWFNAPSSTVGTITVSAGSGGVGGNGGDGGDCNSPGGSYWRGGGGGAGTTGGIGGSTSCEGNSGSPGANSAPGSGGAGVVGVYDTSTNTALTGAGGYIAGLNIGGIAVASGLGVYTQDFTGTSTTAFSLTANSLTSGKALSLSSSATEFTGNLLDVTLSGSGATNTGSLFSLTNSGADNANTTFYLKHYATGTGNLALRIDDASGDTTPFVVDGSGNVGIGTTSPINNLSVLGAVGIGSTAFNVAAPTNGLIVEGYVGIGTTSPEHLLDLGGGTYADSGGAWHDASDVRLKKDIVDIKYGLAEVLKLRPVSYVNKEGYDKTQLGFIAQEVESIVPELTEVTNGNYSLAYGRFAPVLTRAIQEQEAQIASLSAQINGLGLNSIGDLYKSATTGAENNQGQETSQQNAVLASATESASLKEVADSVSGLDTKVTNLEAEFLLLKSAVTNLESPTNATNSANFVSLSVLGSSVLGDVVVNGKLTIGTLTFDNMNGSIDSIGTLKIQSLALGSVDFVDGSVEIDQKGNLNIKKGVIAGNEKIRDEVEVLPGDISIKISRTWDSPPKSVLITSSYFTNISVTDISEKGFVINIASPPESSQKLYWLAIW